MLNSISTIRVEEKIYLVGKLIKNAMSKLVVLAKYIRAPIELTMIL